MENWDEINMEVGVWGSEGVGLPIEGKDMMRTRDFCFVIGACPPASEF